MAMIKDLSMKKPGFVSGMFRLQKTMLVEVKGAGRIDAILVDGSGTIRCEDWMPEYAGQASFNQIFDCTFLVDQKKSGRMYFLLTYANPIEPFNLEVLMSISKRFLPIPDTVSRLLDVVKGCPNAKLQQFIRQVFTVPRIALPFFMLPASRDYHHAYPGGLVEHSLETVKIACDAIHLASEDEKALTITAALLHDLGKVRTLNESGTQTMEGRVLRHEQLTLELLAESLKELERQWLDGAIALRYLLTYTPEHIKRPLLPVAMAIKYADRMSASQSAKQKVFSKTPQNARFVTTRSKGPKSTFWRLQSPVI